MQVNAKSRYKILVEVGEGLGTGSVIQVAASKHLVVANCGILTYMIARINVVMSSIGTAQLFVQVQNA